MPESPETKGPAQVNSPTSMGGGTATGVREVSRPHSGSNAGNCLRFFLFAPRALINLRKYWQENLQSKKGKQT